MAAVVSRAIGGVGLLRRSFGMVRTITASSASSQNSSAAVGAAEATEKKKKTKRREKNLFEVAQFLPNWGIGYKMAKSHWKGVSYEITKINLYKDGRHGKAWGIVHKDGVPAAHTPKKISGVHKRCWKYISEAPNETNDSTPKPESTLEQEADSLTA
ncbi:hypothetical protein QJS04_geneDACA007630 [Acorus gramineus]|uniref:Mitochondrial 28S ribosomal protein S34 n=1 Tax=Acorus gramineus TaxID=55184 RepID=A0AAV9B7D1_ACOGR|nr:hypothetical protein QJS04_geneDACA007630 [Acorus gramineus]